MAALCADPDYLDVVVLCEATEYAWHGGRGLRAMTTMLTETSGRPMTGLLGVSPRGECGPAVFLDASRIAADVWYGYGVPFMPEDKANWCRAHVIGGPGFSVLPIHFDYQSGERRRHEAALIGWAAGLPHPTIVAGNTHSLASGPHEPTPESSALPAPSVFHKGQWPPGENGVAAANTAAMDYLIGTWQPGWNHRSGGIGFCDLAEVAHFDQHTPGAPAPTTHRTPERGGPTRIDRALGNTLARDALVPGSFRVQTPPTDRPAPSDHRVLRFALDLPHPERHRRRRVEEPGRSIHRNEQETRVMGSCSWCGGSGTWTDPQTGDQWPCIKCNPQ